MKIERIAFIGLSKARTRTTRFMVKGLRHLGKEVLFLNAPRIRRRVMSRDLVSVLLNQIDAFRPDLILSFSKNAPDAVLEFYKGRVPIAMFWPDYVEPLEADEELLRKARLADIFFMTNKGLRDKFSQLGVRYPVFCPQACDDDEHRRIRARRSYWKSDVAFVGRPHGSSRIALIKSVSKRFQLKVWGGDWRHLAIASIRRSIHPREYAKICNGAKIVLGCDFTNRVECCFSNRTWIVLGCAGFLLTNYVPGLETIFRNHEHLVWYNSEQECIGLIRHYLEDDAERRRISENGFEFVHRMHNYRIRMKEMIAVAEQVLGENGASFDGS